MAVSDYYVPTMARLLGIGEERIDVVPLGINLAGYERRQASTGEFTVGYFARVAPVYTVPDRRGRGYATALVAALSRELLARGKRRLFLTTDAANPTSNAIYARIGYRPQNEDCHFDFVTPMA